MSTPPPPPTPPTVIRLGQFLKWAGLAASGGEAKVLIAEGAVAVNGEVDTRRRRQLKNGDVVEVGGVRVLVDVPEETDDAESVEDHDRPKDQSAGV